MPSESSPSAFRPRLFVRGDIDGFFGLALDNLIQVLLISALWTQVLGFSTERLYGRILPGVAVSLVVGNLFYAWQARELARKTGRSDVCALPYGINTVSLIGYVFLVMLPAKLAAANRGASPAEAEQIAFAAGVVAAIGSGVLEAGGAFVVGWLRRWTPARGHAGHPGRHRHHLHRRRLSVEDLRLAAGRVPAARRRAPDLLRPGALPLRAAGRPGGGHARHGAGLADPDAATSSSAAFAAATTQLGLHLPVPVLGAIARGIGRRRAAGPPWAWSSPWGSSTSSARCRTSTARPRPATTTRPTPSLLANGIGTVLGASFGSPFPTTIYIGHPGWKALGARIGYSVVNGVFFTIIGCTGAAALVGYLVPIEAGMAIVLWIGIVMVAQAFQATPREHAPAVAVGLLPGIAAWGALMLKNGLRAAGLGTAGASVLGCASAASRTGRRGGAWGLRARARVPAHQHGVGGADRGNHRAPLRPGRAVGAGGAALSLVGLVHSYAYSPADTIQDLAFGKAWPFALAYALLAGLLAAGRWLRPDQAAGH